MSGKSGFVKDAIILFVITLVAGTMLGGVYGMTKEPIRLATIEANNRAYRAVFSEAQEFPEDETLNAAIEGCNTELQSQDFGGVMVEKAMFAVDAGGQKQGYVITAISNDSYGGAVKVAVGVKEDGTVTGVELLQINDTPGLGLKAKDAKFKGQYVGKNVEQFKVVKGGAAATDSEINSISGATITSAATTNAVNAALYFVHNCINQ